MGAYLNPIQFQTSTDPRKLAANQRALVWGAGDVLNQENLDQASQAGASSNAYLDTINQLQNRYMMGQGGYSPEEASAIAGDPSSYTKYFRPEDQNKAVQDLQAGVTGAVDPSALRQRSSLGTEIGQSVGAQQSQLGTALGTERAGLTGAIDPSKLGLSSDFAGKYLMTPQQQQDIVTSAGVSAGLKDQQAVEDLERSSRAAGMDPVGVSAYRARMARQQAIDSANAMTNARIAASNAAAGRLQTAEGMRLGTEQDISGRQMTAATTLGGQEAANINTVQEQGREADLAAEANRQAAEQYLTGARMQGATIGGEAGIQNQQFQTTTGSNIAQAQDVAGSTRATGIANTRIGQQNLGLQGQQQTQAQMNQNQQNAYNRQQQTYATKAGAGNVATGQGIQASQTPSTFDKITGAVGAGVGAIGAAGLNEGAIIDKPTVATVADQGPEAIVPLNQSDAQDTQQRNRLNPWWRQAAPAMAGMGRAITGAGANNPYAPMAAGAGALGGWLANRRAAQQRLQGAVGGLDTYPTPGPSMPPPDLSGGAGRYMGAGTNPPEPMAEGRVVNKPTVALLGDRGPEAVVPMGRQANTRVRPNVALSPTRRRAYGEAA